jgi:hypothetical protein
LDNSFQNFVILEKQQSTPIVLRKGFKNRVSTILPNFLSFHFSQKQCCQHNPGFTGTGHIYYINVDDLANGHIHQVSVTLRVRYSILPQ